jgi:glycosyltransferase involved in cell wall biosynthesis
MTDAVVPPSTRASESGSEPRPTVSVLVPAFQGERTLPFTLASLARQDYPTAQWLIIDDGSSDTTRAVVETFLRENPGRGRLLVHAQNWGLSRSLNHGMRETHGDFVLILHQDLELKGADWISRAVRLLASDSSLAVVTGYYGIPARDDLTFVKKAFGTISRQFHFPGTSATEYATFTEFKSDLLRRKIFEGLGGFPERFRIAGEDLWVSFQLRKKGFRILKDFGLESVQRFSGRAETLGGNLAKTFGFGQAMGLVLVQFGMFPTRETSQSPYSRSRSWFRASQPVVVLGALAWIVAYLVTREPWVGVGFLAWVAGRYVFHAIRVWPDLRRLTPTLARAFVEALGTGLVGLGTDVLYSIGLCAGLIRSRSTHAV